jgi:hypothetical protein
MGLRKILRRVVAFLLAAAVAAGFLYTFRYHSLIRRAIGPDGVCGPYGEVLLYAPYEPRVAPDGDWFIFYARNILGYYAVAGGSQYGPYDVIVPLIPGPEGRSWGFVARERERLFVIIDGELRAEYVNEGVIFPPPIPRSCWCATLLETNRLTTLSDDGQHWAFKLFRNDDEYAIVNGAKLGPYEKVYSAIVSPEGENWGLTVAIAGKEYAVVNGETYGPFGEARYLRDSYPPLETNIAFSNKGDIWIIDPGKHRPRTSIIVNGEEYGGFRGAYDFRWSDDGRLWAVPILKGKRVYFLVNGMEYGPYQTRRKSGIPTANVSPDGKAWGACYSEGDEDFVVINGRIYGPYEYTAKPYFSADGRNWGFEARKNGRAYKVINGVEWEPYEEALSGLWFGGTSWAFWAKKQGAWYVVVDGAEWGPYSTGTRPGKSETRIVLSAAAWAFCNETDEGYYVIVDGEGYGPYDCGSHFLGLSINDDGTAWALFLSDGYKQPEHVVVNGVEYGPFYYSATFRGGRCLGFWALEGPFVNSYRLVKKTAP